MLFEELASWAKNRTTAIIDQFDHDAIRGIMDDVVLDNGILGAVYDDDTAILDHEVSHDRSPALATYEDRPDDRPVHDLEQRVHGRTRQIENPDASADREAIEVDLDVGGLNTNRGGRGAGDVPRHAVFTRLRDGSRLPDRYGAIASRGGHASGQQENQKDKGVLEHRPFLL